MVFTPVMHNIPSKGTAGAFIGDIRRLRAKKDGHLPISDYFFHSCHYGLNWKPRLSTMGFILLMEKMGNALVCCAYTDGASKFPFVCICKSHPPALWVRLAMTTSSYYI